ncbi:MAG: oligosaccharide flippase family protein [Methylobacterium mesophilicum]|nr:oligosaccharide flippase family protein [Methylobacterium mesophilicum]
MPTLSSTFGSARRLATSRSGVLGLTTAGTLFVRMGSSVVLTRLLAPDAFGLVGIIASIFFVITMLTDLGFQSHIVRHEQGEEAHFLDVLWTIHAWRGLGLALLGAALAPIAGWALDKPALTWPLAATSFTLLFNGLTSFGPIIALRRDGARFLAVFDLVLGVLGALFSVLLALYWRNVWALVISMLLQSALRAAASWFLFPDARRRYARNPEIAREFFAFSRIVIASSTLTLILAQTDKLVLARLFSLAQFGRYGLANNLAGAPVSFGDAYISRVVYPIYAKTWRDHRDQLESVYYGVRRKTALLYALGCGGMIGGAPLIIALLYDPRYSQAAVYLSWLVVASMLRLPNFAAAEMMTAAGQVTKTVHANVVRLVWLIIVGTAGFLSFGTTGIVAAVGTIEVPVLGYSWLLLKRLGVLDWREEAAYLAAGAVGAALSTAGSAVIFSLFPSL